MLQYLIIILDDASTSYCHYSTVTSGHHFIDLANLRDGILFAMKENLMIQFVYPSCDLPKEYKEAIETIDHTKIIPSDSPLVEDADIVVFNCWKDVEKYTLDSSSTYVLRICKDDLFNQANIIKEYISKVFRLNLVITDTETFKDDDFSKYIGVLEILGNKVKELYKEGKNPQLNIVTDRIVLTQMNNCNAGCNNITLTPDGKFYICPAFYYSDEDKDAFQVGDLKNGFFIKAAQLYKLSHAPLCRTCDAYQCKRCVWLNRKMTNDINTPSHEQCVVAHLERNESRKVLESTRGIKDFQHIQDIEAIDYLDPFDIRVNVKKKI